MRKEEIIEVEKYFKQYIEGIYRSAFYHDNKCGRKCFHKGEDEFHIIIFDSGEVYQLNSDHEIQGIELETLDALKIRFTSFTGEELENINSAWDEIDKK